MSIIFLDIDGVLTNAKTHYTDADPECVKLLNSLLLNTNAQIVITSTRRYNPTKLMQDLDKWIVITRSVLGYTPASERILHDVVYADTRSKEIEMWLEEHPNVTKFVILDDQPQLYTSLLDHLVVCDTELGLTDKQYSEVYRRLSTSITKSTED